MGSYTDNLGLYKVNTETDGNDTFNIDTMMNDNWDIIDAFYNDIEELKKSVSDGKKLVANAITAKGVTTATDATFQAMANNVANIVEGTVISVTLPEGLMYGDVDKDGELTENDSDIITQYFAGYETILDTDSLAMALADVTGDGTVDLEDSTLVRRIIKQEVTEPTYAGDYKGNWSVAGDWGTAYDKRFYKDITVADSTVGNSAAVFAEADISVRGFKAECFDGYIRVYAKNLPLEAITVNILYTHK